MWARLPLKIGKEEREGGIEVTWGGCNILECKVFLFKVLSLLWDSTLHITSYVRWCIVNNCCHAWYVLRVYIGAWHVNCLWHACTCTWCISSEPPLLYFSLASCSYMHVYIRSVSCDLVQNSGDWQLSLSLSLSPLSPLFLSPSSLSLTHAHTHTHTDLWPASCKWWLATCSRWTYLSLMSVWPTYPTRSPRHLSSSYSYTDRSSGWLVCVEIPVMLYIMCISVLHSEEFWLEDNRSWDTYITKKGVWCHFGGKARQST